MWLIIGPQDILSYADDMETETGDQSRVIACMNVSVVACWDAVACGQRRSPPHIPFDMGTEAKMDGMPAVTVASVCKAD